MGAGVAILGAPMPPPPEAVPPRRGAASALASEAAPGPEPVHQSEDQQRPPPPTPTEASKRRLALAKLASYRLGLEAAHVLEVDIIAAIGRRLLGYNHQAERHKEIRWGAPAALARTFVRPAAAHSGYASVGLLPPTEIPAIVWRSGRPVHLAGGLTIAGSRLGLFGGTYRAVDERDGWPVLQNEHGRWLFRPAKPSVQRYWVLSIEHTPESNAANAHIDMPDGSFPIGEHSWM